MKKTTAIFVVSVFFITLFLLGSIGIIFKNDKPEVNKETKTTISTNSESKEMTTVESKITESGHADLSIPDAKEYDIFVWPEFGIATKIPVPTWSDRGIFYGSETSESTFWAEIGYTTLDDYNDYIESCKNMGYNMNVYEDPGYTFWGENEDGYGVQLTYVPWSKYVGVQVTNNAYEWDHWWEN